MGALGIYRLIVNNKRLDILNANPSLVSNVDFPIGHPVPNRPEWQAAAKALLLVVECNGDPLLAYIGVMRALNAGKLLEPKPARKKATKKYRVVR